MRATVRLGASLIRASLFLERLEGSAQRLGSFPGRVAKRALRPCITVRNDLVLILSSEDALVAYCAKAYDASAMFLMDGAKALRALWEWEKDAIKRFFPPPPGRILVGGAGGGREAFALADLGYSVVAFELSPTLARNGAKHAAADGRVQFFRGAYEDLPTLLAVAPSSADTNITTLGPFDAAIVGWLSYAHVLTRARRVRALREIAKVTRGPILISTSPRNKYDGTPIAPRWLRRLLPVGLARDRGNAFLPGPGFFHRFDEQEFASELREAGIEITHMHFPQKWNDRTDCPYAIGRAIASGA